MANGEIVYFEQRTSAARGTDSLAADIMRHLHARQNLGNAIIICDQPIAMLSACRKQWLKLSRVVQRQRAGTLNADKVMKFTHAISRMQRMHFTCKPTKQQPDADVFCLTPSEAAALPFHPASVYITTNLGVDIVDFISSHMESGCLIVDYVHATNWQQQSGMKPKQLLEREVARMWQMLVIFLKDHNITPHKLVSGRTQNIEAMDDALDTLLGIAQPFLAIATDFQATLAIARPLHITKDTRLQYDCVTLLAHRVQALTTGSFSQRFLESYDEDDAYFLLYFPDKGYSGRLAQLIQHHLLANRNRLADALLRYGARRRALFDCTI